MSPLRLGIVAGEASGDQLAASVIRALRERDPQLEVFGVGGPRMREAGAELWSSYEPLAVFGLFEVLRHLPGLLRFRADLQRRFLEAGPDLVLGVDSPDFNLGLERRLRDAGLRTAHLVSPGVWVWRPGRVHTVARAVSQLLCLLPFEPDCYRGLDLDTRFVGHPLADELQPPPDRAAAKRAVAGDAGEAPRLALLPGSRRGEVTRLLPGMLAAVSLLRVRHPELQVVIPVAGGHLEPEVRRLVDAAGAVGTVEVIAGGAREQLAAADAALLASGTVALEAALLDCPMVVTYRMAPASIWILRKLDLLLVDRFALPNLVTGRDLVPELIQEDHRPELMAEAVDELLAGPAAARQRAGFAEVREVLAQDAAARCAEALLSGLGRGGGRA